MPSTPLLTPSLLFRVYWDTNHPCLWLGEPSEVPAMNKWIQWSEEICESAQSAHLQWALQQQHIYADRRGHPHPQYQSSQLVWLSTRNLKLKLPWKKLSPQYIKPFKILRQINIQIKKETSSVFSGLVRVWGRRKVLCGCPQHSWPIPHGGFPSSSLWPTYLMTQRMPLWEHQGYRIWMDGYYLFGVMKNWLFD